LPFDNGNYKQAPFEDITEQQFKQLEQSLKSIDLTAVYEADDETDHKAEAACAGGACQVV
jgi:ribonucleoside-diphosphate reductase alpha chain